MKVLGERSVAWLVKLVLDVAWWGGLAGLGLLGLMLAGSLFLELKGEKLTMSLPVAVQFEAPIRGADGGTGAYFEKLEGKLRFPARRGAFLTGSVVLVMLWLGFALWIVRQLREVFRSLSRGAPFVVTNARRIRWVGMAVVGGELVKAALIYFWSYYTSQQFEANGLRFTAFVDLNLITIVLGLAIVVIAEVFAEGARLQEEQSLTI